MLSAVNKGNSSLNVNVNYLTCLLRLVVGFLSFVTGDPIFKPKIEQRVNYVFTFCAWQRWDRGAEIH